MKPTHPGERLREIMIPATGITKVEIARLLGVSRQSLYDIVSERQGVTPDMALRLGKRFGDGPDVWLRMQNAHDIWVSRRKLAAKLKGIRPLKKAAA